MMSAGGFIIDDLSSVLATDGHHTNVTAEDTNQDEGQDGVATPKQLTAKQEAKLRDFLDASLDTISRGYRKRYDASSPLRTLTQYLNEWNRVLGVLARIPPYGSGSSNLLISYLLRCSTDICEGISGYGLGMELELEMREKKRQKVTHDKAEDVGAVPQDSVAQAAQEQGEYDEEQNEEHERILKLKSRNRQLNYVLQTLDLVDRIWAAILRGNLINFDVAMYNAKSACSDPSGSDDSNASAGAVPSGLHLNGNLKHHLTSSLVPSPVVDGRFLRNSSTSTGSSIRESLPIHGGKGNRTVGVTDQVRLRNIVISSREKLFAWMRSELDAPPPPAIDDNEDDEPPDNTLSGMISSKSEQVQAAHDADGDGDDPEMEDVDIEDPNKQEEDYDHEEDTEEHRHYQDLFDRKIDPDADDDDDEEDDQPAIEDGGSDVGQDLGASVAGTVQAVKEEGVDRKRKRSVADEAEYAREKGHGPSQNRSPLVSPEPTAGTERDQVRMSRSEAGSLEFSISDAVGQWDLAFTRLFSKTLRTLSDLSEFSGRKQSAKDDNQERTSGISVGTEREDDAGDDAI